MKDRELVHLGKLHKTAGLVFCRSGMLDFLREQGVLQDNNAPYVAFIDKRWFVVKQESVLKPNSDTVVTFRTFVTSIGITQIRNLILSGGE